MNDPDNLSQEVTDAVSETNATVLGLNPALVLAQTQLALAQSQSMLLANMVHEQHQQVMANGAAMSAGVCKMHGTNSSSSDDNAAAIQELTATLKTYLSSIDNDLIRF